MAPKDSDWIYRTKEGKSMVPYVDTPRPDSILSASVHMLAQVLEYQGECGEEEQVHRLTDTRSRRF